MKVRYLFLQKSLRSGLCSSSQVVPYDERKNCIIKDSYIYIYIRISTHCTFHLIKETYEGRAFQTPLTPYLFPTFRKGGLVLYSVGS